MAVETAEEGLDALDKERFDVIIADCILPGMDGLEFLRLASSRHPKTVNILITAYGGDELASKAIEAGAHDCIQKPFSPETLIESLGLLLKNGEEKTRHCP